jgi:hypothetical protein
LSGETAPLLRPQGSSGGATSRREGCRQFCGRNDGEAAVCYRPRRGLHRWSSTSSLCPLPCLCSSRRLPAIFSKYSCVLLEPYQPGYFLVLCELLDPLNLLLFMLFSCNVLSYLDLCLLVAIIASNWLASNSLRRVIDLWKKTIT